MAALLLSAGLAAAEQSAAETFRKTITTASVDRLCREIRQKGPSTSHATVELWRRKLWPESDTSAIGRRQVVIGMTEDAMTCVMGAPKAVNRSVGSWGEHKQYVYPSVYIYTENGKVTSYQD